MNKLNGKIALVTGASKGIGAGIAQCLGLEGATVIVGYAKDQEGANRTVAEIISKGGHAWAVSGDFAKPEEVTRAFLEIEKKFGLIDILVNNAGVAGFGALDKITPEEFHRIFNLNVLGLMLATQAGSRLMTGGGSVINISSMAGAMPGPYSSIYSASKGAVNNLTLSLAKELGPKQIRVNAVSPALVVTEGLTAAGFMKGEMYEKAVKQTPLGRAGLPDDIGKVVVFLASNDSYWVSGQVIHATGGLTI